MSPANAYGIRRRRFMAVALVRSAVCGATQLVHRPPRELWSGLLALHQRGVDCLLELCERLCTSKNLVTDHEAGGRVSAGSGSTVVIRFDERFHLSGGHALAPACHVEMVSLRERVEDYGWIRGRLPAGLSREEGVMHRPELCLGRSAHRGLGRGPRVLVAGEREVDVCQANFSGLYELVTKSGVGLVVPLLAERTLEVAHFDNPDRRVRTALNPAEIGARNVGVRRCRACRDRSSVGAGNGSAFAALPAIGTRSAGEGECKCYGQRSEDQDAVNFYCGHPLNRPTAKP